MINKIILIAVLSINSLAAYAGNLEDKIQDLIMTKIDNSVAAVQINFDNRSKSIVDKIDNKEVQNIQLAYFAPNYSSFKVHVVLEESGQSYDLVGRYNAYVDMPMTAKGIVAGSIINDSDITTSRVSLSRSNSGFVTSVEGVIGMQAKRSIIAASLIRPSDLMKQQVIHQGDNVSIVYHRGNIKLRTNGVSMQHGAIGDTIRVRNESTGTTISGTVKARNMVEVGGE